MSEQKRTTLPPELKADIIRKVKLIRDENPHLSLLDICTSMVYHESQNVEGLFPSAEAIIVCTKSFFDIEDIEESQVRKTLN